MIEEKIDLRAVLIDNLAAKVSYVAKSLPFMEVNETNNMIYVDSGLPSYNLNIVTLSKQQDNLTSKEALHAMVKHYNQKNFPMNVWCWKDCPETIKHLQSIGLKEYKTTYLGMIADLDHIPLFSKRRINDFYIKEVSTLAEVAEFGAILSNLYEEPEASHMQTYFKKLATLSPSAYPNLKNYIGIFRDEIVSVGSLMFTGNSVGMYDIATKDRMRGKGIGTAMVQFLLNEAIKHQATYCSLQASPEAQRIYQKAGFQSLGELKVYENA
ncbi:GNAT family N-acetyltransferase [Virgibacillus soli]